MTDSGLSLNPIAPTSATTASTSYSTLLEAFHIQDASMSPLAPLILVHPIFDFVLPYLSLGPLSSPTLPNHAPSADSASPPANPDHAPTSILIYSRSRICRLYEDRNTKWTLHTMWLVNGWHDCYQHSRKFFNEEEEKLEVLLIDDTNQKGYFAF